MRYVVQLVLEKYTVAVLSHIQCISQFKVSFMSVKICL